MTQIRYNNKYVLKMVIFILAIFIVLFLILKLSLLLVPFIIAFAISFLIEPLVNFFVKKLKFPRQVASAITILLVLSTVGYLITLLISKLFSEIVAISQYLPQYFTGLYNDINRLSTRLTDYFFILPPEAASNIQNLLTELTLSAGDLLNQFVKGIVNTAISLPEALIFTVVTILSTYFFSSDKNRIYCYVKSHLPDSWMARATSVKTDLFSALFGYIRTQLIMMSIIFIFLFLGFSIIGVQYALLLGFLVSIIDALPILGTGGILIPWAIYKFLTVEVRVGTSLLVLYLVVLGVRQMVEPKVLSKQIGLHPLVTLVSMYTGFKIVGILGMILGPITVLVLKNIFTGMAKSSAIKEFLNQIKVPENN